jgi:hypothetical protein
MFALAGQIIQRITGKSWKQAVRENIFEPLGIERAAFSPEEAKMMGNCAVPYEYRGQAVPQAISYYDMGVIGPAGCLYLAPREMLKWDIALLSGGEYNGHRILSQAMSLEMISPQMIRGDVMDYEPLKKVVSNQTYGLGLMPEVFEGHRLVHHGGSIDGFIADQSFMPDDGCAFVALTNLGLVRGAMAMRYVAAEYFLGCSHDWSAECYTAIEKVEADMNGSSAKIWSKKPANMPCPVPPADICGTYMNNLYGAMTITAEGEKLKITLGNMIIYGTHYSGRYFYLEEPISLPDMLMEASVDINIHGKVVGFSAALEPEVDGNIQIYFNRAAD